jgi:hypothetical protein
MLSLKCFHQRFACISHFIAACPSHNLAYLDLIAVIMEVILGEEYKPYPTDATNLNNKINKQFLSIM